MHTGWVAVLLLFGLICLQFEPTDAKGGRGGGGRGRSSGGSRSRSSSGSRSGSRSRGFFSSSSSSSPRKSKYSGHTISKSTSNGAFSSGTAKKTYYGSSYSQSRFASFATSPYTGYGYYGGGSRMYFFYGHHSPHYNRPQSFGNDICMGRVPASSLKVEKEGSVNNETTTQDSVETAKEENLNRILTGADINEDRNAKYFKKLLKQIEDQQREFDEKRDSCESGYECDEDSLGCERRTESAIWAWLDQYWAFVLLGVLVITVVMFCCMFMCDECELCDDEDDYQRQESVRLTETA